MAKRKKELPDSYKWEDADICMRCNLVTGTPKGNGLRYCVCGKCVTELTKDMKNWKKNGLYCTGKEEQKHQKQQHITKGIASRR